MRPLVCGVCMVVLLQSPLSLLLILSMPRDHLCTHCQAMFRVFFVSEYTGRNVLVYGQVAMGHVQSIGPHGKAGAKFAWWCESDWDWERLAGWRKSQASGRNWSAERNEENEEWDRRCGRTRWVNYGPPNWIVRTDGFRGKEFPAKLMHRQRVVLFQ